jgi:hypothetical protein
MPSSLHAAFAGAPSNIYSLLYSTLLNRLTIADPAIISKLGLWDVNAGDGRNLPIPWRGGGHFVVKL